MYYKGYVLSSDGDSIVISKHKNEAQERFKNYKEAQTYLDQHGVIDIKAPFSIVENAAKIAYAVATVLSLFLKFFMKNSASNHTGNVILSVILAILLLVIVVNAIIGILSFSGKAKNYHYKDCTSKELLPILFNENSTEFIGAIIALILLCINLY